MTAWKMFYGVIFFQINYKKNNSIFYALWKYFSDINVFNV